MTGENAYYGLAVTYLGRRGFYTHFYSMHGNESQMIDHASEIAHERVRGEYPIVSAGPLSEEEYEERVGLLHRTAEKAR